MALVGNIPCRSCG